MVHERGRHQAAEQVARDVAGDIGGERACRVRRAAAFGQIRQREREGRRHAQPLRDAQEGKRHQIGGYREQQRRDREQGQTGQDAAPTIDAMAEECDGQAGDRHAEGACVDRETDGGGSDLIRLGERRQDGLRREQVDDREKCGQPDDERAQQCACRSGRCGRRHGAKFGGAHHDRSSFLAMVERERAACRSQWRHALEPRPAAAGATSCADPSCSRRETDPPRSARRWCCRCSPTSATYRSFRAPRRRPCA